MSSNSDNEPLRITLEDLAGVDLAGDTATNPLAGTGIREPGAVKSYGTIAADPESAASPIDGRNIFLQAWFYLGAAGLVGALAGWAICEPGFIDGARGSWGNFRIVAAIITLMCVGFSIAESIVERSFQKALLRGALSLPLGIVLGFVFYSIANIIYSVGMNFGRPAGIESNRNLHSGSSELSPGLSSAAQAASHMESSADL
jgi:hypothetical protein